MAGWSGFGVWGLACTVGPRGLWRSCLRGLLPAEGARVPLAGPEGLLYRVWFVWFVRRSGVAIG